MGWDIRDGVSLDFAGLAKGGLYPTRPPVALRRVQSSQIIRKEITYLFVGTFVVFGCVSALESDQEFV